MPTVPGENINISAYGSSPIAPSSSNVLMTLADMKSSGKLQTGRQTKFKQPDPSKHHAVNKKIKVMK